MTTIGEALDREWAAIRHHLPHHHYHGTSPKEAPVDLIGTIEQDLTAAGHVVDQAAHDVLSRHLTLANLAAHVAQGAADVAASPLFGVVGKLALGPAGEAWAAKLVADAAAFFQPQAAALADAEPAPAQ